MSSPEGARESRSKLSLRHILRRLQPVVYQPVAPLEAVTKDLQRTASRGRFVWAHTLRVQSIKAGKPWWQEGEATGHMTSTVRKQVDEQWFSACRLCFIRSRTPALLGSSYPS